MKTVIDRTFVGDFCPKQRIVDDDEYLCNIIVAYIILHLSIK